MMKRTLIGIGLATLCALVALIMQPRFDMAHGQSHAARNRNADQSTPTVSATAPVSVPANIVATSAAQPNGSLEQASPDIVGGEEAVDGAYPWVAAIIRAEYEDEKAGWTCGASLIRPGWVLTAAHCTDNAVYQPLPPTAIDVLIGRHRLSDSDGERIDVLEVIHHPDYNGATYDHDIALLRLSQSSSFAPIELVPAGDNIYSASGITATVVGWGDTLNEGPGSYSDVLRQVQVPIISNEICNSPTAYNGDITNFMLCAGFTEGGKDACKGDSGGPLMVPKPSGGWLQAGIVSWGIGCALPNRYGVYTRVGTLIDWIQAQIGDTVSTPTATSVATGTATLTPTSTPSAPSSVTTTATTTASSTPSSTPTAMPTSLQTPTPTQTPERKFIRSVRASNVRDSVFSISWLTESASTGALYVATNPADLASNPMIFTSPGTGQAHLATATGLSAQSNYYYYIRSGDAVDNNRGSYYRITTGRTLVLPNTDNVRGVVQDSANNPIANCIVLIEIVDVAPEGSTGISALLSTRSDADGYWTVDLGNARTDKLASYFLYSASGDKLNLEVQCAPDLGIGATVDTNNDTPVPALKAQTLERSLRYLDSGWNLISFAVQPIGRYSSERLCAELKQSATIGMPVEIVEWRQDRWSGYICGVDANNFDLGVSAAYFIRHDGKGVLDLSGTPLTVADSPVVNTGWNGINGMHWGAANAAGICNLVEAPASAVELNRWYAAGWDGHLCAVGFNNFAISRGQGYFLKAQVPVGAVNAASSDATLVSMQPDATTALKDLHISNLTDRGAVFSWWTDTPTRSWVVISRGGQIITVARDVRGPQTEGHLHYVQIADLTPDTTYAYTAISQADDGSTQRENGNLITFKTPGALPPSHSAYGQITTEAGRTLLSDVLVLVTIHDADTAGSIDDALLLSSLSDGNGYWYTNLGNARTQMGDIYEFSEVDVIEVEAMRYGAPPHTQTFAISDTFPAPQLEMPNYFLFMPEIGR